MDAIRKIEAALAEGPTEWDYDSNQTPFYNDADGYCRGGDSDGTYCLYGPDFFIDGERYEGPVLAQSCARKDAIYISATGPAAIREVLQTLASKEAELLRLKTDLQFVERWANHHGQKPHMTPQEALSCIQHYPRILEITRSYADGKVPETYDPYAELVRLRIDAARFAVLADRAEWVRESSGGHWVIKFHNKRHTSFAQTVDAITQPTE